MDFMHQMMFNYLLSGAILLAVIILGVILSDPKKDENNK
jgi:hypothetical protein